ncbi:MAG: ABC transporter permease subunit, partial [Clostridiales bacterium]|nr:ABC transporter permease subunit [Clostridiales bacterium]
MVDFGASRPSVVEFLQVAFTYFSTLYLVLGGIFVAIFIASEFSFGTMKNTLSRGAERIQVYLSKFLVCGAGALAIMLAPVLAAFINGALVGGFYLPSQFSFSGVLVMVLMQIFFTVALTAVFV